MREQIIRILQETLPEHGVPANLAEDTDFVGTYNLDSLDMLGVATALEKEFSIRIEDVEWTRLASLADVMALVRERTAPAVHG